MDPAIVSLHDVMPETLPLMEAILSELSRHGIPPITLLVVPGKAWQPDQISRLQQLASSGHVLAAHGWQHCVEAPRGLYHRLHAALISRNVAEHLALEPAAIIDLMRRSYEWFVRHDLPDPRLYVPPAWALGKVTMEQLRGLPFKRIEVMRGLLDPAAGRLSSLPLVGFEADVPWRAATLKLWNAGQLRLSRCSGRPLRIGLHPHDFDLQLSGQLRRLLKQQFAWQSYPGC